MNGKMLGLFFFVWLIGIFLGSTYDYQVDTTTGSAEQIAAAGAQAGKWAGSGSGGYSVSPETKIEYLFDVTNSFQQLPFFNITLPIPTNIEYWETVYQVITWRFSFMEDLGIAYWFICGPFVAMGILSFFMLVYGIITGNITWS